MALVKKMEKEKINKLNFDWIKCEIKLGWKFYLGCLIGGILGGLAGNLLMRLVFKI